MVQSFLYSVEYIELCFELNEKFENTDKELNDIRAYIKQKINHKYNSDLVEEKSYNKY